jgi:hypothetical protein
MQLRSEPDESCDVPEMTALGGHVREDLDDEVGLDTRDRDRAAPPHAGAA